MNIENNNRIKTLNRLLLINWIIFFTPLAIAYLASLPNGNMWSENGAGAVLWLYILLIPACLLFQIIWLVIRLSIWIKNIRQTKNLD